MNCVLGPPFLSERVPTGLLFLSKRVPLGPIGVPQIILFPGVQFTVRTRTGERYWTTPCSAAATWAVLSPRTPLDWRTQTGRRNCPGDNSTHISIVLILLDSLLLDQADLQRLEDTGWNPRPV